jgi:hypothetical protein
LAVSIKDYLYIQPVGGSDAGWRVDHGKPRLTLYPLTRPFVLSALQIDKLEMKFAGRHCGTLQLETHWQLPHYLVEQPVISATACAGYVPDGLSFSFSGTLGVPPYIPTSFPEGGNLPDKWPGAFNVNVHIPWDEIPALLDNADYFARRRKNMATQMTSSIPT